MLRLLKALRPSRSASFEEAWAKMKRERVREEVKAATGKGQWVARGDLHPMANIADRLYRTADGSVHRAIFFPLPHTPEAWFFPDAQ